MSIWNHVRRYGMYVQWNSHNYKFLIETAIYIDRLASLANNLPKTRGHHSMLHR